MGVEIDDDWSQDRDDPGRADAGYQRTWRPLPLDDVLEGTYTPPLPTVGARTDGKGLFYPGKTHTVASETEAGKTWFGLAACLDEMRIDHHVVYLDFEDDRSTMTGRLLTLGVTRARIRDQFHYLNPQEALGTGINLDDLNQLLGDTRPTLAIVDGVTEAMGLHNLEPNDNGDAARFSRILLRRITAAGAACVALDHVTKDREGRGRYALGAVHKLNGLDGAAYTLTNRSPFGIGVTGKSTIKISKDRIGQLRRHGLPSSGGQHWYGDLVLESHGEEFAELTIEPPDDHAGDDFRPTHVMQKLSQLIANKAGEKGLSGRKVQDLARGNAQVNRTALALLEIEGYISPTPHRSLQAYTGDEDDTP